MIYITGDKHGHFDPIERFCYEHKTTEDDVLIVLGDLGVNYYGGRRDRSRKKYLADMPITIMAVRGNHERRPSEDWPVVEISDGNVHGTFVREPGYDSILYAIDGNSYDLNINGEWKRAFVIGGAYSVDKYYRLDAYASGNRDMLWFEDEQLSEPEMAEVRSKLKSMIAAQEAPDYILTHTCPLSMEPADMFLPMIDQSTVDQSMEEFLDDIKHMLEENNVAYTKWFCGHWHTDRTAPDNFRFVFHDFIAP